MPKIIKSFVEGYFDKDSSEGFNSSKMNAKKEGDITIQVIDPENIGSSKDSAGEYIEFEEVK